MAPRLRHVHKPVHTKTQPRTQDAQAQTVEKGITQACSQADLDEHFFARGVSLPAYAKSLDARGATVVAPIGVEVGTALVRLLVVCPCIAPKEREATLGLPPHLPGAI